MRHPPLWTTWIDMKSCEEQASNQVTCAIVCETSRQAVVCTKKHKHKQVKNEFNLNWHKQ